MTESLELQPHDLLIRGVRVRYFEAGSGPALLLVHGLFVSSREFARITPLLARRFRVIAPDLPGFGESERPREFVYGRSAYAETVCDLLAGLDVARAHLLGHSMGGSIALTVAADYPERVERLALINAVCYPFEVPFAGRLPLVPIVGEILFKQFYNRFLFHDYFKRQVFAPGFKYDRASVDAYYDAFNTADSREAALRVLKSTLDFTGLVPKIAKVRAPTLVIWGESDPMFGVSLGSRLAREIPDARIETLPGCGHSPPEEQPERTADLLIRHFTHGSQRWP